MFIPTFPVYIKQLGGNDFEASLPFAVISISALFLRPISGCAADKLGRKPLLLIGLLILLLFNGTFFYISAIGIILVLRFLQGIGWGMTSTVLATVMSDIVPANRRGEGTGYFALSIIIATSLATIAGIEIIRQYSFTAVLTLSTLLVAAGAAAVLGIAMPAVSPATPPASSSKLLTVSDLFEKQALLPAFLCFLHSITLSGIMSFIVLYGHEIGVEHTWIYFAGHIAMILFTRPFAGKLFDRKGHASVILPGVLFMIIGLTLLSYATSSLSLFVASLVYGFGYGAAHPSLQAWAISRSPADRKGAANGTFLSSLDLGYSVGAVLLGFIASQTSYTMMYRSSVFFLFVFAAVYVFHLKASRKAAAKLEVV